MSGTGIQLNDRVLAQCVQGSFIQSPDTEDPENKSVDVLRLSLLILCFRFGALTMDGGLRSVDCL